jgi:hypothetical protein
MDEPELLYDKVLFRVPMEDGTDNVETLWAFDLGDWHYRLDNRPFWAYGVSCGDIVYAPFSQNELRPTFERVVSKGGLRTLRIYFDKDVISIETRDQVLASLKSLGCGYEGMSKYYIVIDFPPEVKMADITSF